MATPDTQKPGRPVVPRGRIFRPQPATQWTGRNMLGIEPPEVMNIIKRAERGYCEDLQDLLAFVLQTDTHVRSVYETLLRRVVGSPLLFDEPKEEAGEIAQRVVEFQRESLELVDGYERGAMSLAHAAGVNVAVCEKEWGRVRGANRVIALHPIDPRDVRFASDWSVEVRTYDAKTYPRDWINTGDEPLRWIVHVPGAVGLRPNMAGILIPCLMPWVFKKYATGYSQQALERWGSPLILGKVGDSATQDAIDALRNALEDFTVSSAGIIEGDTTVEAINPGVSQTGDAHIKFIELLEGQITKGILGSALNVDGGGGTGSYALGVSQDDTTVVPRVMGISDALAETLREQWFAHELAMNAHLFNGVTPRPAEPFFQLIGEEPPQIDQLAVDAGVVTKDEVRRSKGLEEWGADRGGDDIVTPIAKTAPAFSRIESGDAPPPKAAGRNRPHQLQLWTRRPRKTSPTRSASMTQIASVPVD